MREYIQILGLVIIGVFLLWFGYSLFFGQHAKTHSERERQGKLRKMGTIVPETPQTCLICYSKLEKGDLMKTLAFPSISGGLDRLIHIQGCLYCLGGELARKCPVCGASISINGFLVARMFERRFRRPHVHVLGCSRCRKV